MRHFLVRVKKKRLIAATLCLLLAVTLFHVASSTEAQPTWSFFGEKDKGRDNQSLEFISGIYAEISPAVVGIAALMPAEESTVINVSNGSGLILTGEGYIVTNYHVIANAEQLTVSLADGRTAPGEVIGSAPSNDLALIKIDLPDLCTAPLGSSASTKVGQVVFPIGNPGGEQFARSMTMGLISGIDRQMILSDGNMYSLLQTDAAINPGNSGGPLVDTAGRVIGINSVKIVDADFEGMGFAIPIDTVKLFINDLMPGMVE